MKQRTAVGTPIGFDLDPRVPDDLIPMGDGIRLYSPSKKMIINAEACYFEEVIADDATPQPGRVPPTPPTPPPTQ